MLEETMNTMEETTNTTVPFVPEETTMNAVEETVNTTVPFVPEETVIKNNNYRNNKTATNSVAGIIVTAITGCLVGYAVRYLQDKITKKEKKEKEEKPIVKIGKKKKEEDVIDV